MVDEDANLEKVQAAKAQKDDLEKEKNTVPLDYTNAKVVDPAVKKVRSSLKQGIMEYDSYMRAKGTL